MLKMLRTGKCYNFPENFMPGGRRNRKPRIEEKKKKNQEGQEEKEQISPTEQIGGESRIIRNIPAVFPHEAREALLRELRSRRQLDNGPLKTLEKPEDNSVEPEVGLNFMKKSPRRR